MVNVSVIFPCLNEEKSIGQSIGKVQNIFNKHGFNGEIISQFFSRHHQELKLIYIGFYLTNCHKGYLS